MTTHDTEMGGIEPSTWRESALFTFAHAVITRTTLLPVNRDWLRDPRKADGMGGLILKSGFWVAIKELYLVPNQLVDDFRYRVASGKRILGLLLFWTGLVMLGQFIKVFEWFGRNDAHLSLDVLGIASLPVLIWMIVLIRKRMLPIKDLEIAELSDEARHAAKKINITLWAVSILGILFAALLNAMRTSNVGQGGEQALQSVETVGETVSQEVPVVVSEAMMSATRRGSESLGTLMGFGFFRAIFGLGLTSAASIGVLFVLSNVKELSQLVFCLLVVYATLIFAVVRILKQEGLTSETNANGVRAKPMGSE